MLVIGGAGFIGSHLVERLIAEGESVDVVDDLSTGSLGNLADARAEAGRLASSELRIHTLDATGDDLAGADRHAPAAGDLPPRPAGPQHAPRPSRSGGRSRRCSACSTPPAGRASRRSSSRCRRRRCTATRPAASCRCEEGTLQPRGVRGVVAKAIVDLLERLPGGLGHRVHGARRGHRLRPPPAPRRRRRRRRWSPPRPTAAAAHHRRRPPDPRLRVRRRHGRRARAVGPAGERARRQRRHRRPDVAARPVGAGRPRRPRRRRSSPPAPTS